ncbi:MAG: thiamine-phosphate diphosphorylase [Bradymonadia bacterium]
MIAIIDYETCTARGVDPAAAAALCADAGATILARAKTVSVEVRAAFVGECVRLAMYSKVRCLVSQDTALARELGAHGVHLTSTQLADVAELRAAGLLVGRSTHRIAELQTAEEEGCDYAFFSPVYRSDSKPGLEGQGLEALRAAALISTMPVLALGGVSPSRVASVRNAGAFGVAALGPFAAAAAAAAVTEYRRALRLVI